MVLSEKLLPENPTKLFLSKLHIYAKNKYNLKNFIGFTIQWLISMIILPSQYSARAGYN